MIILINSVATPMMIGCYEHDKLVCSKTLDGRASDVLLQTITALMDQNSIDKMIYVNGPGSYMAIKLTYIILQSIEILRGIPFEACSAFELNGNKPLKAMGQLYFVKEKETIITQKFDNTVTQEFGLPDYLGTLAIAKENTPLYIIPAVQR